MLFDINYNRGDNRQEANFIDFLKGLGMKQTLSSNALCCG